jgi:hypothetical protein
LPTNTDVEDAPPAGGGDTPVDDPPDRSEIGRMDDDFPINPGSTVHLKLAPGVDPNDQEWRNGPDDTYHIEVFPGFCEPTTAVHVYCTREVTPPGPGPTDSGEVLKNYLHAEYRIPRENIKVVHEIPEGTITLNVATGYTEGTLPGHENPAYTYTPENL